MKIHLLTFYTSYREEFYQSLLKQLNDSALEHGVDNIISYTEQTFPFTEKEMTFMTENRGQGFGFYAWKPVVILHTLNSIPENDVIIYHDTGRPNYNYSFRNDVKPLVKDVVENYKGVGVVRGAWPHVSWCKRYCYKAMGCDTEEYWSQYHLTANWHIWQNNEIARNVLEEWKFWCWNDTKVVTSHDCVGEGYEELPGFNEHRWDQAILTNIIRKHELANTGVRPLPEKFHLWEKDINGWL